MINTVTGPIEAESLGTTFIHEHLYVIPNELRSMKIIPWMIFIIVLRKLWLLNKLVEKLSLI